MTATIAEWIGIIGGVLAILTSVSIPIFKWYKKKKNQYTKNINIIQSNNEKIDSLSSSIDKILEHDTMLDTKLQNFINDYEEFSTQNLKYIINDAYFSFKSISELPDDILINACECCEIYVNKRHRNHEIRPRCDILWQELERRAIEREGQHV